MSQSDIKARHYLLVSKEFEVDVFGRASTISRAAGLAIAMAWASPPHNRRRMIGIATGTAADPRLHAFEGPWSGDKTNLCHPGALRRG